MSAAARLSYRLEFPDWAAFTHHVQATMPGYRRASSMSRFGVGLVYLGVGLLALFVQKDYLVATGLLLLGFAWIMLFPVVLRRRTHKQLTRLEQDGGAKGILGAYRLEATDDGLSAELEGNRSLFRWEAFQGIQSDGERQFLMLAPNRALVIPAGTEGTEAFLEVFRERTASSVS